MRPSRPTASRQRSEAVAARRLLTPGLAVLAVVDMGIWTYVACAVSPRSEVVAKAPLVSSAIGRP